MATIVSTATSAIHRQPKQVAEALPGDQEDHDPDGEQFADRGDRSAAIHDRQSGRLYVGHVPIPEAMMPSQPPR